MDCALWCGRVCGHARVAARRSVNEVRYIDRMIAFDSSTRHTGRRKGVLVLVKERKKRFTTKAIDMCSIASDLTDTAGEGCLHGLSRRHARENDGCTLSATSGAFLLT